MPDDRSGQRRYLIAFAPWSAYLVAALGVLLSLYLLR